MNDAHREDTKGGRLQPPRPNPHACPVCFLGLTAQGLFPAIEGDGHLTHLISFFSPITLLLWQTAPSIHHIHPFTVLLPGTLSPQCPRPPHTHTLQLFAQMFMKTNLAASFKVITPTPFTPVYRFPMHFSYHVFSFLSVLSAFPHYSTSCLGTSLLSVSFTGYILDT